MGYRLRMLGTTRAIQPRMTRKQRAEICKLARLASLNGHHDSARLLFASIGISYIAGSK